MKIIKKNLIRFSSYSVCGGVSRSKFLCEYLASVLNKTIQRTPVGHISSSRGAAVLAGIGAGLWVKEDLLNYRKNVELFQPVKDNDKSDESFHKYIHNTEHDYERWHQAIARCVNWYE